jgi:hypothetical protein
MTAVQACLSVVVFLMFPVYVFAWGPIGHMAVGYVAYQRLTPPTKARIRTLLKLNPDYAKWEKQIPPDTPTADHDLMVFMIAATWADDIKGDPQYSDDGTENGNRPDGASSSQNIGYRDILRHRYWHFIDTPFSSEPSPLPDIPAPNAQTQIAAFRAVLASSQPDDLKSYDLVWLLHLIGDVHQPLHATTRITDRETQSDNGGNKVVLLGDAASNLHAYWDDLPGFDCKFCSDKIHCLRRAIVFGKGLKPAASSAGRNTDTATWVRESYDVARTQVYREPIGSGDGPYTVMPWSKYDRRAYELAQKRVALAGARLAQVLNSELR